jgi:hypothetical protein
MLEERLSRTKCVLEQTRARARPGEWPGRGRIGAGTEVRSQLADAEATKRVEWSTELAKVTTDLAETEEMLAKSRDRAERVSVVAPTKALVLEILPKSVGEVLKPGDVIVSLVPLEGPWSPRFACVPRMPAIFTTALPARVKLTAFDPEAFGPIDGKVLSISPTTFRMEKANPTTG